VSKCRITVLGSSSGMPSPARFCPSLLFQTENLNFLLDCGEGTSFSLQRNKIDPELIDSVFISHCHSDHLGGLFLFIQMFHLLQRRRSLRIFLPEEAVSGVKSFLQTCYLFPEKINPPLSLLPITTKFKFEEEGIIIKAHANRHLMSNQNVIDKLKYTNKMQSFCFVLNIVDKKIIYSGDIESSDDLAEIIDDADLLITECFHPQLDRLIPLMAEKRVKMAVFTHIPPELEEKQDEILLMAKKNGFEKLVMAYDGMVINI
jgi:ribonuclease BN (tRNA processing enzyme)